MIVKAIKTKKITVDDKDLFKILNKYLTNFEEKKILAVSSKIVSICEGSVIGIDKTDKERLIERQAKYYLPKNKSKYNITLTIKDSVMIPAAGIDESNGGGYYILWPKNAQQTANKIREYLCKKFKLRYAGVIITDSKTTPLRWGTTGVSIAHCGFLALNNYIGQPDIFNRQMLMTKANIADSLADAAVVNMGEGNEQTPLSVIEDLPFVKFQPRNPTQKELDDLFIDIKDDIYSPILQSVRWKKGGS